LIESELFGHEKGAFTGAVARRKGKFEEANGGTIFLDEIAELDLTMQSKLLRVLQERELERVGGNEKIRLDLRLIVATHKDLAEEVRNGNFREDLFFRVLGLPIDIPPLRERGDDILLLAKHFLKEFCKENKLGDIKLSTEARSKLYSYNFPGNVRELKAVIDLAAVMSDGVQIKSEDISFTSQLRGSELSFAETKSLREYTCEIVDHYLKKNNGDVLKTADDLDMGKSTIYKMINNGELKEYP
jgi:transcriptional regulator with GAF, ATPase, and Fis domain